MEFNEFEELPKDNQEQIADNISAYTQGKLNETPQMLPLTPKDVFGKHLAIVAQEKGAFMGFIACTTPEDSATEIGSLWVPIEYRNQGIASKLIEVIGLTLKKQALKKYAFVNPLSEPLFRKAGYVDAKPCEVPSIAFEACGGCPMKPSDGGCCDKVLIYKEKPC